MMKRSWILMMTLVWVGTGSATAAPSDAETAIRKVTVYADRAQVTREGRIRLSESATDWVVDGLPGWIDAESIRVALEPASAGQIMDVTTETTHQAQASEEVVRKADAGVQEMKEALADLGDERLVIEEEIKQLAAVRAFSLAKLPRDMAVRPIKIKTMGDTMDFVTARYRKALASRRGIDRKRAALQPELNRRQRVRAALSTRSKLRHTRVNIKVAGRGNATLRVTYLTPGATWEPVSELRTTAGKTATLIQSASVVQTTGEDWDAAKLSFSTQRPGETLKVPTAKALLVGGNGHSAALATKGRGASFSRAQSSYKTLNRIANNNSASWRQSMVRQQTIQTRALASFDKLRKRSTTAHFEALRKQKVRADGKPVRVPIARATFPINARVVAVPEVSLDAVRTAELLNSTDQPILPGRVALFVDGAFVGRTVLSLVAPGEKFSVFLGVNDGLKLDRKLDRKRSSIDRGRRRTELAVSYIVSAENLTKKELTLSLTDRVPAVQDDDIELDDVVIPKGAKRDRDGLVTWTRTIKPGQRVSWRIEYQIEYPTGLALRPTRKRGKTKEKRSMRDEIGGLEGLF